MKWSTALSNSHMPFRESEKDDEGQRMKGKQINRQIMKDVIQEEGIKFLCFCL